MAGVDEAMCSLIGDMRVSYADLKGKLDQVRQLQPEGALETLEWDLDVLKDVISSLESKLSKMRQNGDLPS